jgi:hypothetical protein
MTQRSGDVRNAVIGLLTGVVATLAMGQAAAPDRRQPQPVQRYQITGMRDNNGNEYLYVLDHQTQKVYRVSTHGIQGNSPTVEQLIRG